MGVVEAFEATFKLPWITILISLVIILVAIKGIWELIEWFMKKFKIETGSMKEKRETRELLTQNSNQLAQLVQDFEEDHELLLETSNELKELKKSEKTDIENFKNNRIHDREQSFEIQRQLTDAIDKINDSLGYMRQESIDREIARIRWDILKFATDISNGKKASRESYDFISKLYMRYEQLLEETGQENGLVDESVKYIKETYHQRLENGEF
jgi:hypothetical protein